MDPSQLFPAGGGSVYLFIALGVALVFVLAWVLLLVLIKPRGAKDVSLVPVPVQQRERWIARLRGIPLGDLREFHLALAETMRAILGERSRRDVSTWTVRDIAKRKEFAGVAALLKTWEEPSFAPESEADARRSIEDAVREVSQW
ncbi:MAG: hypothetical protein Q3979_09695 [Actinomycetaceae bacterium]|nr:hypothetical protein [Actinomycetaceae bacterium]